MESENKKENSRKDNLMFGTLGNGVTICDKSRIVHGDYLTVAHIAYDRKVTYYAQVSVESKAKIEEFAREGNVNKSFTQPYPVLCERREESDADKK